MTPLPKSLRLRLVLGLSLTMCLIWGGVAAWQFTNMQRELRTMLDDRLIASARMVAGIVVQFQPMHHHTACAKRCTALGDSARWRGLRGEPGSQRGGFFAHRQNQQYS